MHELSFIKLANANDYQYHFGEEAEETMQILQSSISFQISMSLTIAQLLALQIIRRALENQTSRGAEDLGWRDVGDGLRLAHAQMLSQQHIGLVVAGEGSAALTRHERRLLRAVAAAQVPDAPLLDNLIFTLAPGCHVRPFLTRAIAQLAEGLTSHGHRLPLAVISALSNPTSY